MCGPSTDACRTGRAIKRVMLASVVLLSYVRNVEMQQGVFPRAHSNLITVWSVLAKGMVLLLEEHPELDDQ